MQTHCAHVVIHKVTRREIANRKRVRAAEYEVEATLRNGWLA